MINKIKILFVVLLVASTFSQSSMAGSSGQVGNGGFLYYGNRDKVLKVVTSIVLNARANLSKKLRQAPASVFTKLPKEVNVMEMADVIQRTHIFEDMMTMRTNPDGYNDMVMIDYQDRAGQKDLFILAPMVAVLFYMDQKKAPHFLERALILETLHFYGYNQDEAMIWSEKLYKDLF